MIHTFEVKYSFTHKELITIAEALKKIDGSRGREIDCFVKMPKRKIFYSFTKISEPGILAIYVYKHKNFPVDDTIYMKITIEPEALCEGKITNRLFQAVANNIEVLQYRYAQAIYHLFPMAFDATVHDNEFDPKDKGIGALPYLACGRVSRIDYAVNLYAENKELVLMLAKNSYFNGRKSLYDFELDNHNLYASTSAKTRTCKLYDKQRCYQEKQRVSKEIYEEAEGILRFEVSITEPTLDWIVRNSTQFDIETGQGVLPYLNEEVADKVIQKEYASIGFYDWYNDYTHKKMIANSDISKREKDILSRKISPIISQSRSIRKAEENYIGKKYTIAKTQKIVSGSKSTFRKHLKTYAQIGIQPLRIPDKISTEYQINQVKNPFHSVVLKGKIHEPMQRAFLPPQQHRTYEDNLKRFLPMILRYRDGS